MESLVTGNSKLHPFLDSVASLIRSWRSKLPDLEALSLDLELQSIFGTIDGQEFSIKNELHKSLAFRKLHLEVALIGSDFQILHCVFFPDPQYDIPIFGADVVVSSFGVNAAIVDLSPVSKNLSQNVINLLDELPPREFSKVRQLPDWASIFSSYVLFVKPNGTQDENHYLEIVDSYLRILLAQMNSLEPDEIDSPLTIERHKGQTLYCNQQRLNQKTKAILSKAFNPNWADRYIEDFLFDFPPPLKL